MPKGGVVRLSRDDETLAGLHLVEGLESGLALMVEGFRPCWSMGSTWVMAEFPVLAGIEALRAFADNDKNGAGLRSARAVEARWLAAGRDARIIFRDHNSATSTMRSWRPGGEPARKPRGET